MTGSDVYRPLVVEELARQRAIVHVDLDCFYCQVEQLRLGISPDVPLAVQQWQGLIAVNYAARSQGVKRMDTVSEARDKCPDIRLVHVPTFTEGTMPAYHALPRVSTHKVSLDEYRKASRQIMNLVKRLCPTMIKASIDEAYLDVSSIVKDRILRDLDQGSIEWASSSGGLLTQGSHNSADLSLPTPLVRWSKSRKGKERDAGPHVNANATEFGVLAGDAPKVSSDWGDLQLRYAAEFAKMVRATVLQELGYQCSAGVAHNMMLAKIGSALNKPSQQTVFCQSQVEPFMRTFPITSIPTLGGKFGAQVESTLDVQTAGDVMRYTVSQLSAKLGAKRAQNLYDLCRGIDAREVADHKEPQSLLSAKNFGRFPVPSMEKLERWLSMNGTDLWMRVMEEWEMRRRWPRSLTVNYMTSGLNARSKTVPFPLRHANNAQGSPDAVVSAARACFAKIATGGGLGSSSAGSPTGLFPLVRFSLQANSFHRELANASIMERFLSKPHSSSALAANAAIAAVEAPVGGCTAGEPEVVRQAGVSHAFNGSPSAYGASSLVSNDAEYDQSDSDADSEDYDPPPPPRPAEADLHQQLSSTLSLRSRHTMQINPMAGPHHSLALVQLPATLQHQQHQAQVAQVPPGYDSPISRLSTSVSSLASTPPLMPSHKSGGGMPMKQQLYNPADHHLRASPFDSPQLPPLLVGRTSRSRSGASSEYETTDSEMSCLKTPQESDSEAEGGEEEGEEEEDAEMEDAEMEEEDDDDSDGSDNDDNDDNDDDDDDELAAPNTTAAGTSGMHSIAPNQSSSFPQPTDAGNLADGERADAVNDQGPPSSSRSTVSSRRRNNVYIQPNVDSQSAARYGEGYRHMDIDRHDDGSLVVASPEDSQSTTDGFLPALIAAARRKREIQIFKFQHSVDMPEGAIGAGPRSGSNSRGTRGGASAGNSNIHSRQGSVAQPAGGGESSFMASVRSKLEESKRAGTIAEDETQAEEYESSDDGLDVVLDIAVSAMMDSISSSQTVMQIRCPQCPESAGAILSSEWEMHRDWHVARHLQERELRHDKITQQFRRAFGAERGSSGSRKPPAKRAKHDDVPKKKQSTLAEAWR